MATNSENTLFTMADSNTETLDSLLTQLGGILGVGSRDDGRKHLSDMCVAYGINMNAKHKAVRHSNPIHQEDTWRADDGWCGFDLTNALVSNRGVVDNIPDFYTKDGMNGWEYAKPRGASRNEYNRIRDFDGYYHKAVPFVKGFSCPNRWAKNTGLPFAAACRYSSREDEYSLTHYDLPLVDYYFGVVLVGGAIGGSTKVYRATNSQTIGDIGFNIDFDISYVTEGLYSAFPFISTRPMAVTNGDLVVANIFTLPNCLQRSITIVQSDVTVSVTAKYSEFPDSNGNYSMTYNIKVTNAGGSAITLNNNVARLRFSDNGFNTALVMGEKEVILDNITVQKDSTASRSGTITGISKELMYDSIFWVSIGTATHLISTPVITPMNPSPYV